VRAFAWSCGRTELMAPSPEGLAVRGPRRAPEARQDPIFQIRSFLRDELAPQALLLRAVSFANRGQ